MILIWNELEKLHLQRRPYFALAAYAAYAVYLACSPRPQSSGYYGNASQVAFLWVSSDTASLFFPLATALMISDTVAGERSSGTLKLLLVQPAQRWKILLSKFAASLLVMEGCVLFGGICFFIALGLDSGFGSMLRPILLNARYKAAWEITGLAYLLELLSLASCVSLFVGISTAVRSAGTALALCLATVFGGFVLAKYLQPDWGRYLFIEHWGLADHLINSFPLQGCSLSFSVGVLLSSTLALTVLSCWIFQQSDVTD